MTEIDSLNQYLTEKVLGDCWHYWYDGYHYLMQNELSYPCHKCQDITTSKDNPDFTTEVGWWKLMDHAIKQDDFDDFLHKSGFFKLIQEGDRHLRGSYLLSHLNWLRDRTAFPKAYARFKGWKGE